MRVAISAFGFLLTTAIIVFAIMNPNTEVEFSALMIAYRGNLLGLALVLVALAVVSFGLRAWMNQFRHNRGKKDKRVKA
jgi:uncharacterized membrane protein YidH (DUF202 family)